MNTSSASHRTAVAQPSYDPAALTCGIVHFGVGNFHRSHQAMYLDRLMNAGQARDWAICGVGVLPGDRAMQEALAAQDHRYTLVLKYPDGHFEARTIASIVSATAARTGSTLCPQERNFLRRISESRWTSSRSNPSPRSATRSRVERPSIDGTSAAS